MSAEKLAARIATREYFFYITDLKPNALSITMYGAPYTFVKTDKGWVNHDGNKMNAAAELIDAVVNASGIQ